MDREQPAANTNRSATQPNPPPSPVAAEAATAAEAADVVGCTEPTARLTTQPAPILETTTIARAQHRQLRMGRRGGRGDSSSEGDVHGGRESMKHVTRTERGRVTGNGSTITNSG